MKNLLIFGLIVLMACNAGTNADTNNDSLPNPELVNPAVEAIPEDMKIKNDSVVVPDTARMRQDSLVNDDTLKQ